MGIMHTDQQPSLVERPKPHHHQPLILYSTKQRAPHSSSAASTTISYHRRSQPAILHATSAGVRTSLMTVSEAELVLYQSSCKMANLRDRNVLITGGASGLGLGFVHAFAKSGSRVIIADFNDQAGIAVEQKLREEHCK